VDALTSVVAQKLQLLGAEARAAAHSGHRSDVNALDMAQAIMNQLSYSPEVLRNFALAQQQQLQYHAQQQQQQQLQQQTHSQQQQAGSASAIGTSTSTVMQLGAPGIQGPVYQEVTICEPSLLDNKSIQGQEHIPPPLPPFPPEYTYRATPIMTKLPMPHTQLQAQQQQQLLLQQQQTGKTAPQHQGLQPLSQEAESALAEQVLTRAWRESGVGTSSQVLDELEQVRQRVPLMDR